MEILVIDKKISNKDLKRLVDLYFKDMVKYVVDIAQNRIAIGGELHADGEQLLLDSGSNQKDIWGANYYPDREEKDCIEFTALINIRPSQGNPGMEIMDKEICERVKEITFNLIGRGECL